MFEEFDYCPTPIVAESVRRRRGLRLGVAVFEITLGQKFLMTLPFTATEVALARLGLAPARGAICRSAWAGWAEPVTFGNPPTGRPFTQTVSLARKGAA